MTGIPYTRRFFGAAVDPGESWQTIWTTPADGYVYILRDVRVANRSAEPGTGLLDVLTEGGTLQLILAGGPLEGEATAGGEMRQELLAGDLVRVLAQTVFVSVVGTGYRLKA